ncbi:MAG: putative zinc-binding metallopeptidase, partial [Candidatus Omnitrophica bacterium]|nr:putative zinc-binding metallopeptidase [Candidatus Omnitrophota bacterium]
MAAKQKKQIDLDNIPEEELLNTRICDLPLGIEGTWIAECIGQLHAELQGKGISFAPECYLADEWLTPKDETCIGIPFYLAHPNLIRLEKKFMIDAEGETKQWCMKLLRHEAGHAICYAHRFHKRKRWQSIFGPATVKYADTFKYRPYSKNYVQHLDGYYAQYHPDEDFAETFAVWLNNKLDWREKYKGWKAINKLNYVDTLMDEIKTKDPIVKNGEKYWVASDIK